MEIAQYRRGGEEEREREQSILPLQSFLIVSYRRENANRIATEERPIEFFPSNGNISRCSSARCTLDSRDVDVRVVKIFRLGDPSRSARRDVCIKIHPRVAPVPFPSDMCLSRRACQDTPECLKSSRCEI